MAIKTRRKKNSSTFAQNRAKPDASGIANTPVSRRTVLKGGASAAAVIGVSVAMKGLRFKDSSTSTTTYSTITPSQTNTGTVPPNPPITATDPFGVRTVTLNVNGTNYSIAVAPRSMLADVLRDTLGLIATKKVCNRASCGACTVLIDGAPYQSCHVMTVRVGGQHTIVTSEIATGDPVVNALQQAWVTQDGSQCGQCSPGNIMTATALLKSNPKPTVAQIKDALSGNLCRCGQYAQIIAAVQTAAQSLPGGH
jgi:aerobic-type carbon monoxide dehydrogenase small subunit (CoxS/CutS family)